ncbi:Prolipoprotein diacylglyceryl transferase [Rickettsiales endosymbiont of Paramecium tredecaurelia]|uniref:prolipoprotein diacylglyceryl transferase n=1 Tax=Candidatus Sarmatiella mevalonica TaxID=2770581 RepID=UPI001FC82356|nr:prolipoprotein diacylglyceryl transferase [Candidatus Sarmatiella mevalonica]MBL3284431.1 Prolipoprotein diacylglyceryl transferase [Candidatus Sarmatiella mevalonica]
MQYLIDLDPVIFSIGIFSVSYYSLSYVIGIMFGWSYSLYLIKRFQLSCTKDQFDAYISWLVLAVICGGRLGYVLFYDLQASLHSPLNILKTYEGGMSFHGALLGIGVATYFFAKKHSLSCLVISDLVSVSAPIGIFLGRIANFINKELLGRQCGEGLVWKVQFHPNDVFRHPSQIYEALLEGALNFIILYYFIVCRQGMRCRGKATAIFLINYAVFRIFGELFRESVRSFIPGVSQGQILSLPMLLLGLLCLLRSTSRVPDR